MTTNKAYEKFRSAFAKTLAYKHMLNLLFHAGATAAPLGAFEHLEYKYKKTAAAAGGVK